MRTRLLLLVLVALAVSVACGGSSSVATSSPSAAVSPASVVPAVAPTLGDQCLVGTWTVLHEADLASINSQMVAMSGLDGTTLTINSDGSAVFNYDASKPLAGLYGGKYLGETFRGRVTYKVTLDGNQITLTGVSADGTLSTIWGSVPQGEAALQVTPTSTSSYTCTPTQLDFQFADPGSHTTFTRPA